ncbi:integrin linked kinase, isoform CRA_d [Rattus norvegicus]|uniref:Integrin linked kinase, isoform CRA_d n=1 Tax=Rattus norvegicus TaxID=10116 RepID=A6I7M6_RAT|nr:integrin linked kinase, isoform CRA_d [Rattus norvegicus]EDM18011.1 integrin linked kinase, isoform CRA_d [Rattus norvegicus]
MDDIFTQCREGNAVAVRLWLDNTENDLNQGDDHGFSPLHWACREGRSAVVEMLIMRGARINVMNRGDDTPLHLAASHGHRDIVQKLLQYKADINAVNEHGNVPLHYACFWGQDQVAEVSTQTPGPMVSGKQTGHGTISAPVSPTVGQLQNCRCVHVFMLVCDWPDNFLFRT